MAGFYSTKPSTNRAVGFIRYRNRTSVMLTVPGACSTEALGVNDTDEVVGAYGYYTTDHGHITNGMLATP